MLLDNVPDYLFWLAAAALSGAVVVGINSTYRGDQLGLLVRHTDCQLLVTDTAHRSLLDGADMTYPAEARPPRRQPRLSGRWSRSRRRYCRSARSAEDDLFLLIFTSGSTGLPKAVRCTQGRFARTGAHVAGIAALGEADVVYSPLPFFHSSSLFTGWSSALNAGVPIATRDRFSASATPARYPPVRRDHADLHRQGPQLHPGHARASR